MSKMLRRVHHRNQKVLSKAIESLECRRLLAVVINEFLADNQNGILDQNNDRSDWVELYNNGASPASITGWYLTDSAANLTKWQFPATTISAGGYLKVFASGKNRAVAGQELHTNFSLAAAGEDLLLVQSNGTTIADSFVGFPAQDPDRSYGRAFGTSTTTSTTLVGDSTPLKVLSPSAQNAAVDDFWNEISFDDSAWSGGTGSVGFDRANGSVAAHGLFTAYIGTTLTTTQMPASQTTAYVRFPFTVTDKDQFTALQLQLRYDDGYFLYLNGHKIDEVNIDHSLKPVWNSRASDVRANTTVVTPVTTDLTSFLPYLVNGANVLAIQGVNSVGTNDVGDLLVDPQLIATRATAAMTGYMAAPTPGALNGAGVLGFVGDTHFSVDRGFFDAPFQVAITSTTAGASFRYTLDGSVPSETYGTLYTGPLTISSTTILRAIAYKTGYKSSNADTETYLFLSDVITQNATGLPTYTSWGHTAPGDWTMDPNIVNANIATIKNDLKSIPSVSIVMNWNDLFGATPQGIYSNTTQKNRESWERAMSMEYFNSTGADQFHVDAAIEVQGGSSAIRWRDDKLSFQVKFKFPYGDTKTNYAVYTNSLVDKTIATQFNGFVLDAQYNYTWSVQDGTLVQNANAKYVQDQVVSDLQNVTGGGGPHGKFVNLYLNGRYWGIYDMHERPDSDFAASYYGNDPSDYDVIKHSPTGEVDGGITAINNYAAFLAAARADMKVQSNFDNLANNFLDVDEFIDYMIVHYYAGNYDWGGDNYYASHSRQAGGKWRYHAWDQEHSFQDMNVDLTTYTQAGNNINGGPIEVHYSLLNNPEYKLRFADHAQKLLYNNGPLTPISVAAIYNNRMSEIDRAIIGESARWGDNRTATAYTRANWLNTKTSVVDPFIAGRTNVVINQFIARGWLQTLAAPTFNQYGGTISPGFSLTMAKPSGSPGTASIYYTLDGSDPRLTGGTLSPTALLYSSAVTLNVNTRVIARIRDGANWSAKIDASFFTPTLFPLRIVELNYHPANHAGVVDPEDMEFVELLNTSASSINLQGCSIAGGITYSFGNLTLGAGQRIVVARNSTVFTQVYGSGINLAGTTYTGKLDNAGEQVILLGPLGETLQNFIYGDSAPWPSTPDGLGPTLEIINPLGDPNSAANWRASTLDFGSPGYDGSITDTTPPTVSSSAFLYSTSHAINITFSEAMNPSNITTADVNVQLLPSGSVFHPASVSYNSSTHVATFAFSPLLSDGNYQANLLAGSVTDVAGNALVNAHTLTFFVLGGDANRDRHVDALDQAILAANLNQSPRTFEQGDFDYNGIVNSLDQSSLTAQLNLWLPAIGPLALNSTTGDDVLLLKRENTNISDAYYANSVTPTYRIYSGGVTGFSFAGNTGNDVLTLDYSNGTPFSGTSFTFAGDGGTDTLSVVGTTSAESAVFSSTSVTFKSTTISVSGNEQVRFDGKLGLDQLTINSGPAVVVAATQELSSLTLAAGTTLQLQANAGIVLFTGTLSIAGTSTVPTAGIDLTTNAMVVRSSSTASTLRNSIWSLRQAGANGIDANGFVNWTGQGIRSTSARSKNLTDLVELYSVGVIANHDLQYPYGPSDPWTNANLTNLGVDDILVRYTYSGDSNLDGSITISDYVAIDTTYGGLATPNGWVSGDFDLSGAISISDYVAIDTGYAFQAGQLLMSADANALAAAASVSVVPPGALSATVSTSLVASATSGARKSPVRSAPLVGSSKPDPHKRAARRWSVVNDIVR